MRCPYCGSFHTGICYLVKAIEYYPDGTIKRVELKEIGDGYAPRDPNFIGPGLVPHYNPFVVGPGIAPRTQTIAPEYPTSVDKIKAIMETLREKADEEANPARKSEFQVRVDPLYGQIPRSGAQVAAEIETLDDCERAYTHTKCGGSVRLGVSRFNNLGVIWCFKCNGGFDKNDFLESD